MMPAADRGFVDSLEGTFTWDYSPLPCIDSFTQIFRGEVKVYGNETSLVGALALAETEDVGVGLEITETMKTCGYQAYKTHVEDVVMIVHQDDYTSIAKSIKDPSALLEIQVLEQEISFMHVRTQVGQAKRI